MATVVIIVIVLALLGILCYIFNLIRVEKVDITELELPENNENSDISEISGDDLMTGDPFSEKPHSKTSGGLPEEDELLKLYDKYYGDNKGSGDTVFANPAETEGGIDNQQENPQENSNEMNREIQIFDKLSGLLTGRAYVKDCADILEEAKHKGEHYAVAYLDIDRFRFINSIKGYSLGDYVLSHLSQELRHVFPDGSKYTRLSADHFLVLFPVLNNNPYDEYYNALKKICDKIRNDVAIKSSIRICIGIAITDSPSDPTAYNMPVLIHKANVARHCLKTSKSVNYLIYDESMISSFLYGESSLDDYSENQYGDEFIISYQAISDISHGKLTGCEALAVWTNQDNAVTGQLGPDTGRLPSNNTKVFYNVCRAASRWRKSGKDLIPLYIYITEVEFFMEDFDEFIAKCLSEFQLEPGLINIVLDAGVVRLDWTVSCHLIKRLRDTGLKVGVCGIDLATKSLDFLGGLPINFIKLQAGFARDISKYEEKTEAVRYMAAMAEAQNLRVIVEGVDSIDQMQALQKLGVSMIQGRYNGQPASADDFMKMLDDYTASSKNAIDTTVIFGDVALNHGDFKV